MKQRKRTILITGGNSGMGKAIAARFANEDTSIVILGRDQDTLRATASELAPHVVWYQADVSQRQQVQTTVASIVEQWGQIDVLINAAGFVRSVTTDMTLDEAEQEWDAVLDTNLKGSFLMTVAVAPYLVRPGGRIIYISSIAAFNGGSRAGSTAYAAAKAGLHGLTYGFARELSAQGITVNAVAPGFIANTGFTGAWSEERIHSIVEQTPVGRAGQVNDVAAAVQYLASPEASFVTGEILNVNGGWLFGH
ncbi:SDR family NAD(P)-dependent oxidoreductase [Tengunoibacter tsumagoiensis]|uniref:Short-chain dehydrogenase n=1 Tax=Tengunoibacter tsumagoiensis TaxID=2014871 RepID=A0A402A8K7_9CHLR|nr:SDR family oxidoreductase [Tengunoibacter tsumagoiensis]GCE15473.1 short-chain dehydrogenase [Tengunoibacter tsumagoiensis]